MARVRLGTLLVVTNVTLLLLAVAAVALPAALLLQRLAAEQALARVSESGARAAELVERAGEELLVKTRLLGERPTLQRLLIAGDRPGMQRFIEQFCQTGNLDGCLVMQGPERLAAAGMVLPADMAGADPGGLVVLPDGRLALVARAPVDNLEAARVLGLQALDARFEQRLSEQLELPTTLIPRALIDVAPDDQRALRQEALARGRAVAVQLDQPGRFVVAVPLVDAAGARIGLVEVALPATGVAGSARAFLQALLVVALAAAACAALAGALLARWLVRPLRRLTDAAARIGYGDLDTPVTPVRGAEAATLGATLDDMRRAIRRLTTDLRHKQAETQALLDGMIEGMFAVDRDRRIRTMTPRAASLLGITPEQAIGRFCGDVLNPQGRSGIRPCEEACPIVQARFRGGARAAEQLVLADGRQRTVVITSAPLTEDRQVQLIRDETEAEAARRLRDAVLANISHEFKTPLAAQLASIELLLDRLPELSSAEIAQLVRSQQRGSLRLTQLIDNLLESVRIEAGQIGIRRRPVAVDVLVEEALELTRPLLEQRGQEVQLELPYPAPMLVGDGPRLVQVLVNLLANANKYAPPDTCIRIGASADGPGVALWVEDQGTGLPPVPVETLFARFVRAGDAEPEQSGMGLGLWIVKSIVERHGGRITAHSTPAGTRMQIVLPHAVPR